MMTRTEPSFPMFSHISYQILRSSKSGIAVLVQMSHVVDDERKLDEFGLDQGDFCRSSCVKGAIVHVSPNSENDTSQPWN